MGLHRTGAALVLGEVIEVRSEERVLRRAVDHPMTLGLEARRRDRERLVDSEEPRDVCVVREALTPGGLLLREPEALDEPSCRGVRVRHHEVGGEEKVEHGRPFVAAQSAV